MHVTCFRRLANDTDRPARYPLFNKMELPWAQARLVPEISIFPTLGFMKTTYTREPFYGGVQYIPQDEDFPIITGYYSPDYFEDGCDCWLTDVTGKQTFPSFDAAYDAAILKYSK